MSGWIWFLLAWTAVAALLAPVLGRMLRRAVEEQTYEPTETQQRWWAIWRREGKDPRSRGRDAA